MEYHRKDSFLDKRYIQENFKGIRVELAELKTEITSESHLEFRQEFTIKEDLKAGFAEVKADLETKMV